uniref:Isoform D of Probable G-protein coupled receptor Mth-like 11 n=1 Tax=Drosophila melanogaster TaxID=7227 RepID=P83118-2|nr:methuselah-like 11, isoform D [Drosophila melanogaster]AGB95847.1 methuselah-like 11, isoform D [Drosophila melanogaster]|eukprot:NP_001262465.1 methuselah-like 11, isoform D [Drosophila melanogaster]
MGMFRVEYLLLGILVIGVRSRDIPNCDFFDTVQLRESEKLCNGSYRYEDVVIPAKLTGKYDYEIDYDGDRVSVPKHIRGCVCKLKTCIRFCCHHKKLMAGNLCSQDVYENLTYEYTLDITQLNGSVIKKHVLNDMVVQQDLPLPCERHYSLDAETSTYDMWSLYENGSLFRHFDQRYLSKQEFCLQPNPTSTGKNYSLIVAFNCIQKPSMKMAYVKFSSVFFMVITIAAYLWLPKFRSLHGKCCNLYFICLAITFLLNVISLFGIFELKTPICYLTGYAGYFTVMATFLWLSVISFDVWRRFAMRKFQVFYKNKRSSFFNYNIIVWSSAGLLTCIIFLVDQFVETNLDNPYNPAVGVFSCWIFTNGWSATFYFYAPLAILIILNCASFFLTTRYIYVENKQNQKVLNNSEPQKLSRNHANYRIYFRLFIIMGGSWFLEIIAFICEMENMWKPLIILNDYINCSQGIIIFVATFCNHEMFRLIRKRIQNRNITSLELTNTSRPVESEKMADVELGK